MKHQSYPSSLFKEDFAQDIGKTALKKVAHGIVGVYAHSFFDSTVKITPSIHGIIPVGLLAAPLIVLSGSLLKLLFNTHYFSSMDKSLKDTLYFLTLQTLNVGAIVSAALILKAPVLLSLVHILILPVSIFLIEEFIKLLAKAPPFVQEFVATTKTIAFSALGYAACSALTKCVLAGVFPSFVHGVSLTTVASVGALTAPLVILPALLIRFLTNHYGPNDSSKKHTFLLIAEVLLELAAITAAIHLLSAPFAACFICTLIIPTTVNLLKNLWNLQASSDLECLPELLTL